MDRPDYPGILTCARYSFAPNSYHYCGPDKSLDLGGYIGSGVADRGLGQILNRFETMYPYLKLIAGENNIHDPFDARVVEAYWIGNRLLAAVGTRPKMDHFIHPLGLGKKLPRKIIGKITSELCRMLPTHTDYVLGIFIRTGHHTAPQTLSTMDQCRISWGEVIGLTDRDDHGVAQVTVKVRPLRIRQDKLVLGQAEKRNYRNPWLLLKPGDLVTLHWGFVCDKVSPGTCRKLYANTSRILADSNPGTVNLM